jgi:non-ribosomal peptide synthetase component F
MWNRRWLHDYGQKARQIKYWKEKLSGLAMLELPLDLPRPSVLSVRGTRIGVAIDADLTQRFVALLSTENVNPFVGLLSLYMILLHRWSGEDDFAVGIALGNRHHEGIEDRIGYFANEVAIRAEMSESPSFTEILQIIRDNVMGGMANADVPFHEVTEALNLPRDRSRTSVFQAMFALQEREWHTLEEICPSSGDLTFNLKQFAHNTSKFEVHLQLRYDGQGGLEGDFHIATDLFTAETGRRLVEGYEKLMSCCITEPSLPVKFHDITPQMDLDLSRQCNLTTVKYEATPLLDMFASIDRERIAFLSHAEWAATNIRRALGHQYTCGRLPAS